MTRQGRGLVNEESAGEACRPLAIPCEHEEHGIAPLGLIWTVKVIFPDVPTARLDTATSRLSPTPVECCCPCGCRQEIDPPAFNGERCPMCSEACGPRSSFW